MLAVMIADGRPEFSAAILFFSSCCDSTGCRIEYVPAEPQHKCASGTGVRLKPSSMSSFSTWPFILRPCCSEQGGWNANLGTGERGEARGGRGLSLSFSAIMISLTSFIIAHTHFAFSA